MGCVKILDNNYADPEVYANIDESSAQTSFPITNVLARVRRSKVWRSNGYFNVTSSNNQIVFRDDTTTNITASIAVGEYTSTSSFMAAVDAALEAVGAANYTVTQNAFYKFVITSDLSGGATAFQLRCSHASFTAESLLGFDNATDLTGASSYTADYLRINSSEWITFDFGLPVNPTDFVMIGARNNAIKLSPTGTFKLQGNSTNNFTTTEYETTLSYDDEAIIKLSDTGLHTSNLRYWRVLFEDQNPNGYVEIGAIFLGNSYVPTRGSVVFPFSSTFEDASITVKSEGGQTFSEVLEKSQMFQIEWNGLTKGELEEINKIWEIYGTSQPFFMVFDSASAFTSSPERLTRYIKFTQAPNYELISPNNYNFSMNFREEL